MIIDAAEHVGRSFPTTEGAQLAIALLKNESIDWADLEVRVESLPSSLLISAFFNAFLQAIVDRQPELLLKAKQVKWKTEFPFQDTFIRSWVDRFEPNHSA